MLRQTSTLLALSLTALAMSSCGVFSHHKKAPKKHAAKPAAASHAAKPSAVSKPSESAQEKKASEPAPKNPASTESGETATPPKSTYPTGTLIPGKTGLVLSPYNNREVDVTGIPSGKLVSDPTYPASEKKYFRVP
jgi:hypothetical protein